MQNARMSMVHALEAENQMLEVLRLSYGWSKDACLQQKLDDRYWEMLSIRDIGEGSSGSPSGLLIEV